MRLLTSHFIGPVAESLDKLLIFDDSPKVVVPLLKVEVVQHEPLYVEVCRISIVIPKLDNSHLKGKYVVSRCKINALNLFFLYC